VAGGRAWKVTVCSYAVQVLVYYIYNRYIISYYRDVDVYIICIYIYWQYYSPKCQPLVIYRNIIYTLHNSIRRVAGEWRLRPTCSVALRLPVLWFILPCVFTREPLVAHAFCAVCVVSQSPVRWSRVRRLHDNIIIIVYSVMIRNSSQ